MTTQSLLKKDYSENINYLQKYLIPNISNCKSSFLNIKYFDLFYLTYIIKDKNYEINIIYLPSNKKKIKDFILLFLDIFKTLNQNTVKANDQVFKLLDEIKIEFLCYILNNRKEYQLKIDTKNLINLINLPLIQIINQAEVINIENLMPKLDKIKHNI